MVKRMESIKHEKISKTDDEISEEVVKSGLERIRACYQCGTCTGGCPSGRRTALRTRAVIRKALLGLDEVLKDDDIWLCSTCYTCYERCPRDVPVTDIIIELRNLATKKGYMKDAHRSLTHLLIKTGHGVPIPEGDGGNNWRGLRKSYNLNELPPTTHTHPEAVHDIQVLVHSLRFDTLVNCEVNLDDKKEESENKEKKEPKSDKSDGKKGSKKQNEQFKTNQQQNLKEYQIIKVNLMAEESKELEYSLYLGCVIPNRYPMTEQATRNVLKELGISLKEMEGASCCPAPGVFRSFDIPTWLTLGARNITIAEENEANIVTMCNGCYGTLLEVNHTLQHNSEKKYDVNDHLHKIGKEFKGTIKVEHLAEVLYKDLGLKKIQEVAKLPLNLKVAVHYGCHLLKPSKIRPWDGESEDPRFFDELVEALGCESINYKEKLMCCGAGGGVRSAVKEVSLDFTKNKLMAIREAGADCIVVMCPFCQLQLDLGQVEVNSIFKDEIGEPFHIPVFYYTQLLGLSMGINPNDLGLVKKHQLKGVPPFVNQDELLQKIYKTLGYSSDGKLQKK